MRRVAVVTDSSASLPKALAESCAIDVVPLAIVFGRDVYADGALPEEEFYARLRADHHLPTTAAPPLGAFLEAFLRAGEAGLAVFCVTLTARLSGTYSAALQAARLARQERPGLQVEVMDSGTVAMGTGFIALAAARAALQGADLETVTAVAEAVRSRVYVVGVLESLHYLAKGGRVPKVAAWASSLLQVKPIIQYWGGDVGLLERVRTQPRALERLLAIMEQRLDHGRPLHVSVLHAAAPATAQGLAAEVQERFQPQELFIAPFTQVLAAHTGPGLVGLAFYSEPC